jgi:PAS domain S-box-containing protein
MTDQDKTRQQLLDELGELRERVAALEGIDAERQRVEEELAKSKAILTAAVECLPFDFYALDPTGRCILQNAVSRRYYGDALGKVAEDVCPDPRALPRWLEANRRALAGQLVEEETEWQVEGQRRHFYNIIAPIRQDGTLHGVLGVNVDVTARRRAEEALRQSEARYRALTESTRDIIYILDRQGTLLYANGAASHCIGIPCAELVGKRQVDLFPPEMARAHIERTVEVFATGQMSAYDDCFYFGPVEVWLRVHLLPLRDDGGQITAVMGVCHDITERKRTEESLRQAHDELERRVAERTAELTRANEELAIFQRFADTSGQGFGMADLDGRIKYLNPALCRMLGEERAEDVVDRHLSAWFSEESNRRGKEEILPALQRDGYWQGELPLQSRRGTIVPSWHHTFLIRDERGAPHRVAVVISDITERKRAEEALRQSERRFRNYFEQGLIGMAVTAVDKRWLEVNDRLCEMLGYSREELLRTDWAAITHPDDVEPNLRLFTPLLSGEIEHFTLAKRYVKKDGSIVYTTIYTRAFRGEDGAVDHVVTLVEDVTARTRAEQALRESETRYRSLFANMAEGFAYCRVLLDEQGRPTDFEYLEVNEAFGKLTGLVDVVGKRATELFPGIRESYADLLAAYGRVAMTGQPERLLVMFEPLGMWLSISLYSPQPEYFAAVFEDVTERKLAEGKLAYLASFPEMNPSPIMEVDLDGDVRYMNSAATRLFPDLGRQGLTHPWLANLEAVIRQSAADPSAASACEVTIDGHTYQQLFRYVAEERVVRIYSLDITARKLAEEALQRERRTLEHMLQASDHERRLIAYDIHDGLAQQLAGAIMQFQVVDHLQGAKRDDAAKAFGAGMAMLRQSHSEARRLISGVRPPILDESGVMAAIAHLIHDPAFEGGPQISFRSRVTFNRLAPVVENVIYRIVQEALTNARLHSQSQKIAVSLVQRDDYLRVEIRDWGVGFDPQSAQENRFGLEGIRERARLLGGSCTVQSEPGKGTCIVVELPVAEWRQE